MTSVILMVEAFCMPLDDIQPLINCWRRYLYQISIKKAFVDHDIDFLNARTLFKGRTLLSTGRRALLIGRCT
jgi:hypothetical protein